MEAEVGSDLLHHHAAERGVGATDDGDAEGGVGARDLHVRHLALQDR